MTTIDQQPQLALSDAALLALAFQPTPKPMSTTALVTKLKDADQDHEFYPTTDEIIRAMVRDIRKWKKENYRDSLSSVLDIGAGNGKVLMALQNQLLTNDNRQTLHALHAIEKSSILCAQLPPDILVVGTALEEQSLLSKEVDLIFCNPPYSKFVEWTVKIIRESCASLVYLVIPERWKDSTEIEDARKFRDADVKDVGSFDFEDADRKARAKVNLLRIEFTGGKEDAFQRFFDEQFAEMLGKFAPKESPESEKEGDPKRDRRFHKLVVGPNYPEAMVSLYNDEMGHIHTNYQLVNQLDADLLRELEVSPPKIMACLKARMSGLKNDYWMELFSNLGAVTDRLTHKSRKALLDRLHKHVQVDFTVTNIYEIVLWLIKNANIYIERQLIETYEVMIDKCNVHLYKSNKKVWVDQGWRYNGDPEKNSHFALDYRIVTHRVGGVAVEYSTRKLSEQAAEFLGDLLTIARNLGFYTDGTQRYSLGYHERANWVPGELREFRCIDPKKKNTLLFDVRGFKNRNLHLRLNQDFILALNVEHGRLKGWLKTPQEAVTELDDANAAQYFNKNIQLTSGDSRLLLAQ